MDIKRLTIENFKGLRRTVLSFNGNAVIGGRNATGKSTVRDAFLWLLFGKDGQGKADFAVKPRGGDGSETHNLISSVEAIIGDGSREIVVRRELTENWVKPRGSTSKVFQGNETAYQIDGVPTKKKDYDQFVAGLAADETLFRILTDSRYFCEMMDWKERRKALATIAGIDTRRLIELDGERAKAQAALKGIKEESESIPVRIDEARRAVVPVTATRADIEKDMERIKKRREEIKVKIGDLAAGSGSRKLRLDLEEIESRIKSIESEQNAANRKAAADHKEECDEAQRRAKESSDIAASLRRDLERLEREENELTSELDKTEKQYKEKENSAWAGAVICPTCNQPFPAAQTDESRKRFNSERVAALKEIDKRGEELDAKLRGIETQIDAKKKELNDELATAKNLAAVAEQFANVTTPATVEDERLPVLRGNADKLRDALKDDEQTRAATRQPLDDEDRNLDADERAGRATLATIEANTKAEARVKELVEQQTGITQKYADAERRLMEIEQETRRTAADIEQAVAAKFNGVQFRLFEEQINGGLREVCTPMIGGVPYDSANNAARINAGLKIIAAIGAHHGKQFPVFIDNAEAVNIMEQIPAQTIQLRVTNDENLTIKGGTIER